MSELLTINSIRQIHELMGIEKPMHPLISVIRPDAHMHLDFLNYRFSLGLYFISLKNTIKGNFQYGRNSYDFEEGTLLFTSPGQVLSIDEVPTHDMEGWNLVFHPDLIRKSHLGATITNYNFFHYDVNEALHLSEKERKALTEIVSNIEDEINQNMDRHSQELIIHNIETILKYSNRFYDRQFFTRTNENKDHVIRLENFLAAYFNSGEIKEKGLPTVTQCGEALNISGYYLSDLLKAETGKSTKEHIQLHLVEKAKNILLNSNQSIGEIAFHFGFEYPQNFSKLFKVKTGMSPSEYRNGN